MDIFLSHIHTSAHYLYTSLATHQLSWHDIFTQCCQSSPKPRDKMKTWQGKKGTLHQTARQCYSVRGLLTHCLCVRGKSTVSLFFSPSPPLRFLQGVGYLTKQVEPLGWQANLCQHTKTSLDLQTVIRDKGLWHQPLIGMSDIISSLKLIVLNEPREVWSHFKYLACKVSNPA